MRELRRKRLVSRQRRALSGSLRFEDELARFYVIVTDVRSTLVLQSIAFG